ncbi:MAG: endopeptidase La [Chloroflexi bacterium]|nr:endopeptidase La [Chloroflexota bacterium]
MEDQPISPAMPQAISQALASPSGEAAGKLAGMIEAPLLPLVENIIFPRSVYPLTLRGEQAESLFQAAQRGDGLVALFLQKDKGSLAPTDSDLYSVGTLARLSRITPGLEGLIDVTAEGIKRVRLVRVEQWEPHVTAHVEILKEDEEEGEGLEQLAEQVRSLYRGLLASDSQAAEQLLPVLDNTDNLSDLAYLVAATIPISSAGRQAILEISSTQARLLHLLTLLAKAHELSATRQLNMRNEEQREAVASARGTSRLASNEQISTDRLELESKLRAVHLPVEAAQVAERELERLSTLSSASPEYSMVRTYLQALADLPWQGSAEPDIDLDRARAILDRDHYGLADIKGRIIEHLAVRKLKRERAVGAPDICGTTAVGSGTAPTQPVLCLVGPPGVGKTSLGRSIAEALDRPFVRISLGGMSDEAEIRGHRQTYMGAMPGRIVQSLTRLGSSQPVMMLDELDKVGSKGAGDPTAALLDVLDPEQQREFVDHYINVPFDISCVFFIATANTLDAVPEALRDRLEVIALSGYTEEEKLQIAIHHIVPRQMEWHALEGSDVEWEPEALLEINRSYTREAGVRQLEREIATVCRRIATSVAQDGGGGRPYRANATFISEVLGTPRFLPEEPLSTDQPGVVTGLFWTPVGGDVMHVEVIMMPGDKTLTITGQLGEVMRESAQAALSFVRSRAESLGIDADFYNQRDIHLHIPSGAVSKDGPSAGVTVAVALVSLLTETPVPGNLAMSGEITLTGRVLPVGGVKEKVLAARRAGIDRVILPAGNRRDLDEIPAEIVDELEVIFADNMDEVLAATFPRRAP